MIHKLNDHVFVGVVVTQVRGLMGLVSTVNVLKILPVQTIVGAVIELTLQESCSAWLTLR